MKHQNALLFFSLEWHEAHTRPLDSLTEGFRTCGIVLLPLDGRLYISGRNYPHAVTKSRKCERFLRKQRSEIEGQQSPA